MDRRAALGVLIVAFLAGGCGTTGPIAPTPAVAQIETLRPNPQSLIPSPSASVPTPAPNSPPAVDEVCDVPQWQQARLNQIIGEITKTALDETRRTPGLIVYFEIEALASATRIASTHIAGELRGGGPSSGYALMLRYTLIPGSLSFPNKATFLHALQAAVPYQAEVRLVGGDITCCPDKPAIAVTGRFEGDY